MEVEVSFAPMTPMLTVAAQVATRDAGGNGNRAATVVTTRNRHAPARRPAQYRKLEQEQLHCIGQPS